MTKSACILFLYSFVISTWAYPSGAPPNLVCDTMSVKHDPYESQTSDLPYTVTIDKKTVQPSGETDITISGKDFKGFFVQVRRGDKAVGSFVTDSEDGEYQAMTCHNNKNVSRKDEDSVLEIYSDYISLILSAFKQFQKSWTHI